MKSNPKVARKSATGVFIPGPCHKSSPPPDARCFVLCKGRRLKYIKEPAHQTLTFNLWPLIYSASLPPVGGLLCFGNKMKASQTVLTSRLEESFTEGWVVGCLM